MVRKLLKRLNPDGEVLNFCYEAGPCGYELYRQLKGLGHECNVVAPSLIPCKARERIKTDRRDGLKLARLHRSGELTAVWVPDAEQEAIRDLIRAREDMKCMELKARQRVSKYPPAKLVVLVSY
ncbi:MAG: transposase [Gammaproteobacteria bacterium]|nr:transposase [Gammaproteobacteria bacterium]